MPDYNITIEEITDAEENARINRRGDMAMKNALWLSGHWPELLPQARGKFVAVAGQQAYIADTDGEARRLAAAAHPDDEGLISQYVYPHPGPRVYGHLRSMATE